LFKDECDNLYEIGVKEIEIVWGNLPTFESRKMAPWSSATGIDRAITSEIKARWHRTGAAFTLSSDIDPPSFVITNMGCKNGRNF
jgi:hypothetical protein